MKTKENIIIDLNFCKAAISHKEEHLMLHELSIPEWANRKQEITELQSRITALEWVLNVED